jgi:hypothetical protein
VQRHEVRKSKNYAIFLSQMPATAYAVRGLIDPFEILIGGALPVWVHTVPLGIDGLLQDLLPQLGLDRIGQHEIDSPAK